MAAEAQIPVWTGPSRRRVPRFRLQAPVDVTVLRSGIPDTVPGRSVNVCERGIGAMLAGELVPGEIVAVEVQFSRAGDPLHTRATVRYQEKLSCGLEFVAMPAEQRAAIRDWAKEAKAATESAADVTSVANVAAMKQAVAEHARSEHARPEHPKTENPKPKPAQPELQAQRAAEPEGRYRKTAGRIKPRKKRRGIGWIVAGILVIAMAAGFWWKWSTSWEQLESGLKPAKTSAAEPARVQVPAEVMERLVTHRVDPVYPAEARAQKLEGTIALDIVVGPDGSVTSMRALNGPELLAQAAMDALRWWKFDPYRVNGEPVMVETTVSVTFRR